MNAFSPSENALIAQFVPATTQLVHREFPNYLTRDPQHQLSDALPSTIYPAFYGCYDWHSAVHSHWQLIRAARFFPNTAFADKALAAVSQSLTAENLEVELAYLEKRQTFERPYGWAWLLQLSAECIEWQDGAAQVWQQRLQPLADLIATRLEAWLPALSEPIRSGLHKQTAFSLGLAYDWAVLADRHGLQQAITLTAQRFFLEDGAAEVAEEPFIYDFLSHSLGEADLMRRLLGKEEFAEWFGRYLPPDQTELFQTVSVADPSNGKLAHFGGLNLSRAWMLEGICHALTLLHPRHKPLMQLAAEHKKAGLPYAIHTDYMLSHWVPTFALYLLTKRGISQK